MMVVGWKDAMSSGSGSSSSSSEVNEEAESKRPWKKKKKKKKKLGPALVEYHSLPEFLRDNEYILGYYRSEWPLKQVLLSIFYIHNETLNVWTHLIGFFLFLFLTIYTAIKAPNIMDNSNTTDMQKFQQDLVTSLPTMADFQRLTDTSNLPPTQIVSSVYGWHISHIFRSCLPNHYSGVVMDDMVNGTGQLMTVMMMEPITRWPLFAFMGGAMFCLLASCMCHLFSCHSQRLSYIMVRLDYAGIAALISTSFYPPVYYSFMCNPLLCCLYLTTITLLGAATIIFSLLPNFDKPQMRSFRASLFFGMGVSGVAPIIHKLILYRNQAEAIETTCYEILMGVFYGIGALIYAMRLPERWKPGRFDIAGQSHQLFHILVVAGAYTHYHTALVYLQWRDANGC